MDYQNCSGRTLAFLGDAVWSYVVRRHLLLAGEGRGKVLQKKSISYVSAKAQAYFYTRLHDQGFFTKEEEEVFHRGRNDNSSTVPNHTAMATYRVSTGFEAVIGMLNLEDNWDRIEKIWDCCRLLQKEKECQN